MFNPDDAQVRDTRENRSECILAFNRLKRAREMEGRELGGKIAMQESKPLQHPYFSYSSYSYYLKQTT